MANATEAPVTLSIVVVSLTSQEQTLKCLQQLRESNVLSSSPGATSEVIVVDLVGEQSAVEIETAFPCVSVISAHADAGFAGACNLAIAAAQAEHILLIDPFTEIPGRLVPDMVLHLDNNERVAAVGPQLIDSAGLAIFPATHFPPIRNDASGATIPGKQLTKASSAVRAVEWLPATCLMINREALDEVGGFEEGFLLQFEEINWCKRARDADWRVHHLQTVNVVVLDQAEVIPGEGVSAGELPYDGQFSDSRRAYVRLHHSGATALAADAVKGAKRMVRSAKAAIGLGSDR